MIRRTAVFALGLALVATLAIPSGPVFAMSLEVAPTATTDGSLSLLDRIGELTTDLWLWMTGAAVSVTKSEAEPEPFPVEESDGLTGQSALVDPNGLD